MLEVYTNIKNARKLRGWSQSEFAARLGYADKTAVSKIENGRMVLTLSALEKIARVLGVRASDLMGFPGEETNISTFQEELTQDEFALVEECREADERGTALAHETLKICKSKNHSLSGIASTFLFFQNIFCK